MGAEYINSPENNNEDYPNENLHLYESNPFANPDTNLERDNLPDEDLYERAIFIQNQLEEKSNETSIIKTDKNTYFCFLLLNIMASFCLFSILYIIKTFFSKKSNKIENII